MKDEVAVDLLLPIILQVDAAVSAMQADMKEVNIAFFRRPFGEKGVLKSRAHKGEGDILQIKEDICWNQ